MFDAVAEKKHIDEMMQEYKQMPRGPWYKRNPYKRALYLKIGNAMRVYDFRSAHESSSGCK